MTIDDILYPIPRELRDDLARAKNGISKSRLAIARIDAELAWVRANKEECRERIAGNNSPTVPRRAICRQATENFEPT